MGRHRHGYKNRTKQAKQLLWESKNSGGPDPPSPPGDLTVGKSPMTEGVPLLQILGIGLSLDRRWSCHSPAAGAFVQCACGEVACVGVCTRGCPLLQAGCAGSRV